MTKLELDDENWTKCGEWNCTSDEISLVPTSYSILSQMGKWKAKFEKGTSYSLLIVGFH